MKPRNPTHRRWRTVDEGYAMLAADKDDAREALAWTEAFIADWFAFESEDDRMANQQWYAEWVAGQVDGAAEPT